MTGKIFRSIMAAAAVALLASALMIMSCLYDYFGKIQAQQLMEELSLAAAGVEKFGKAYLESLPESESRLTWIAADGSVLFDAKFDEKSMENHSRREEITAAMTFGEGRSVRYSDTLLQKTMYCAKRLSDNTVLRISVATATMGMLTLGMARPLAAVLIIVFVLALWLAARLAKRIVEPLNSLDLDHPLENNSYDELAPLLTRIAKQRCQIEEQLHQLEQKNNEFSQITDSMNEGLVLLSEKGRIVSMNPAAKRLFRADKNTVGEDFLTVERGREINDALQYALKNGHGESCITRDSREYQIDISRIESGGAVVGLVMLSFDVTEKRNAERLRREFSANVSHELKTPLTAVLGSSEMLENGMVKPEDIPRFAGHIHAEAARLLTLIEDIIRLSRLDEGAELVSETVDIAAVAAAVAERLSEKAEKKNVGIKVNAKPCPIEGNYGLVYEIVYNLTDNAVKYNVEGGNVEISVEKGVLTVSDSGIGIPAGECERVFERFYRVDKSHSDAVGGTGLGLSIVKHACAYLGAEINLKSSLGSGTTVTVAFLK